MQPFALRAQQWVEGRMAMGLWAGGTCLRLKDSCTRTMHTKECVYACVCVCVCSSNCFSRLELKEGEPAGHMVEYCTGNYVLLLLRVFATGEKEAGVRTQPWRFA